MERQAVRVGVVGGGFGGLEAALYLKHYLGEAVHVTLFSDHGHFLFRPYLTYVPFGLMPEELEIDLAATAAEKDFAFVMERVLHVDPFERAVHTMKQAYGYDYLILATGATIGPDAFPGLRTHAYLMWLKADMIRLRAAFHGLLRSVEAGEHKRVLLLVSPGCQWAGPLYETAFMLDTWLQWKEAREGVELYLSTPEKTHMGVFGAQVHEAIHRELGQRRIVERLEHNIEQVEEGVVIDRDGNRLTYDMLLTSPVYVASVRWEGLPADPNGFLRTVSSTRQLEDHPEIYVVGDASDYPVKQAYLALQQADVAAEHLVARVQGRAPAFSFDPSGLWIMEQFDQALFANVPMDVPEEAEVERVPVGELRRLLVSDYLPRPYGVNPLYAGLLWKGTKVGLKVLQHVMR